eukprot:10070074-Alexandrium_andersonii.AAC.1
MRRDPSQLLRRPGLNAYVFASMLGHMLLLLPSYGHGPWTGHQPQLKPHVFHYPAGLRRGCVAY